VTTTAPPTAQGSLPQVFRPLDRKVPVLLLAASVVVAALLVRALGGGPVLTALVSAVLYAAVLNAVSRRYEGSRRATDRTITVLVTSAFLLALLPLVSILWTILSNGAARFDLTFFTQSMRGIRGEGGGALHAIQGTLIVTGLAAALSIPVGMLTAIYLVEYGRGRLARAITFLVDVMTGIPSIVAGLFAYALFVVFVGPGARLGIGGAVALSVLMLPVVVRSTEEMLKLVPAELREASYALGVPKWRTILKVVLPVAAAGIATGVTLSIARVIGETAPLLLIMGITTNVNLNPFSDRMATLPVYAFYQFTQPGTPPQFGVDRAWTAALVLMLIVLVLNLVARVVAKLFAPKGSR